MDWKEQLLEARKQWFHKAYPEACKDHGVPLAKPYRDNNTNGLTRSVFDWMKFHNHYVNRLNSQGQARIEKIKCFGGRVIEKTRFTRGTTNQGHSRH